MVSPGGEAAKLGLKVDLLRGRGAGELDIDVDLVGERRVACFEVISFFDSGSGSTGDGDSLRPLTR